MKLNIECEYNAEFYKACSEFAWPFYRIFKVSNPHILIKNLKNGHSLFKKFPELAPMNNIYQDKKNNHSLFSHSVKVLEYTYEQTKDPTTLIAAFLHDYGKIFTYDEKFKFHDKIGLEKVEEFLIKYKVGSSQIHFIKLIMKNHTRVSQYQRNPNWKKQAFISFMNETHPYTFEIIKVARADKKSSHNFDIYLSPFKTFEDKCVEILENRISC